MSLTRIKQINQLQTTLDGKANLSGATFTGVVNFNTKPVIDLTGTVSALDLITDTRYTTLNFTDNLNSSFIQYDGTDDIFNFGSNVSATQFTGDGSLLTNVSADGIYYTVKNSTASTILKGKVVMAVGTDGNSGHILIDEMVADGSIEPRFILGVLTEDISVGATGRAISLGQITQVDTTGQNGETWTNGTVLWADPVNVGDLTDTEPNGPNLKIPVAIVVNAAVNGKLQVRITYNEGIHDMHDVFLNSLSDGDLLVWDSSNSTWSNDNTISIDQGVGATVNGNFTVTGNFTVNGTSTTVNSEITTADAVIDMNAGEVGSGVTLGYAGLLFDRGTSNSYWLGFDEVRDGVSVGEITTLSTAQIAATQLLATREDTIPNNALLKWDDTNKTLIDSGHIDTELDNLAYTNVNNNFSVDQTIYKSTPTLILKDNRNLANSDWVDTVIAKVDFETTDPSSFGTKVASSIRAVGGSSSNGGLVSSALGLYYTSVGTTLQLGYMLNDDGSHDFKDGTATFGGKVTINHGSTSGALDLVSSSRYSGISFSDDLGSGIIQYDGTTDRFNITKELNVTGTATFGGLGTFNVNGFVTEGLRLQNTFNIAVGRGIKQTFYVPDGTNSTRLGAEIIALNNSSLNGVDLSFNVDVSGTSTEILKLKTTGVDVNGNIDATGDITSNTVKAVENTAVLVTLARNNGASENMNIKFQGSAGSRFLGKTTDNTLRWGDSSDAALNDTIATQEWALNTFSELTGDNVAFTNTANTFTQNQTIGDGSDTNRILRIESTNNGTGAALNNSVGGEIILRNKSTTNNTFSAISGYNANNLVTSRIAFINNNVTDRYGEISFLTHNGTGLSEKYVIDRLGNHDFKDGTATFGGNLLVTGNNALIDLFDRTSNGDNIRYEFSGGQYRLRYLDDSVPSNTIIQSIDTSTSLFTHNGNLDVTGTATANTLTQQGANVSVSISQQNTSVSQISASANLDIAAGASANLDLVANSITGYRLDLNGINNFLTDANFNQNIEFSALSKRLAWNLYYDTSFKPFVNGYGFSITQGNTDGKDLYFGRTNGLGTADTTIGVSNYMVVDGSSGLVTLNNGLNVVGNVEVNGSFYGNATDWTRYQIASGDFDHRFYTRTDVGASLERFVITGGAVNGKVEVKNADFSVTGTSTATAYKNGGSLGNLDTVTVYPDGFTFRKFADTATGSPFVGDNDANGVFTLGTLSTSNFGNQLAFNNNDEIKIRSKVSDVWGSWKTLATQEWVTSQNYLTSYNETDTLQSVTARGSSTTVFSTFSSGMSTREVRTSNGQELVLNAGESHAYATGQTNEYVYVNAESGLEVNFTPDNWTSGWAGRETFRVNSTDFTYKGHLVYHNAYHPEADKWTTGRDFTINLLGDASGSATVTVDGSENETFNITVNGVDAETIDGIDSARIPYALNGIYGTSNTAITDGGIGADAITRSMFFRDNNSDFGAIGVHMAHSSNTLYAVQLASISYTTTGQLQYRLKNNGTWTSPAVIRDTANFVSGTDYLTPTGNGSGLTSVNAETITINSNDNFTGTYPILWGVSNNAVWEANWLNVNGATDTLHTVNLETSGEVVINNVLFSSQSNTDVDSIAQEVVATISSSLYDSAFFNYVIKNGTNMRAGTFTVVHDGTNVEYYETSTNDLGDTTGVVLSADLSGGNIRLLADVTTDNWIIKAIAVGI